jgi:hypothetical protein
MISNKLQAERMDPSKSSACSAAGPISAWGAAEHMCYMVPRSVWSQTQCVLARSCHEGTSTIKQELDEAGTGTWHGFGGRHTILGRMRDPCTGSMNIRFTAAFVQCSPSNALFLFHKVSFSVTHITLACDLLLLCVLSTVCLQHAARTADGVGC